MGKQYLFYVALNLKLASCIPGDVAFLQHLALKNYQLIWCLLLNVSIRLESFPEAKCFMGKILATL